MPPKQPEKFEVFEFKGNLYQRNLATQKIEPVTDSNVIVNVGEIGEYGKVDPASGEFSKKMNKGMLFQFVKRQSQEVKRSASSKKLRQKLNSARKKRIKMLGLS